MLKTLSITLAIATRTGEIEGGTYIFSCAGLLIAGIFGEFSFSTFKVINPSVALGFFNKSDSGVNFSNTESVPIQKISPSSKIPVAVKFVLAGRILANFACLMTQH